MEQAKLGSYEGEVNRGCETATLDTNISKRFRSAITFLSPMSKSTFWLLLSLCILSALVSGCDSTSESTVLTNKDHGVGNLSPRDTIFLSANYSECGEWGGHREIIKIYRAEKTDNQEFEAWMRQPLEAVWLMDTIGCSHRPDRKFFLAGQHEISREDELAIIKYMQSLLEYSLKEMYPSHSGNYFSAAQGERELKGRRRLQISFHDTRYGWDEFEPLRKRLFKKISE